MSQKIYVLEQHFEFSAAHQLKDGLGPCSRLHGHNFKLAITIATTGLDENNFVIDFYVLKNLVDKEIIELLDHHYINAIDEFKHVNPTCEVIAEWIYDRLDKIFKTKNIKLRAVSLWENSCSKVSIESDASLGIAHVN